jgi:uncharacterized protein
MVTPGAEIPKPLPVPDQTSAGFWEAAASHVLAIQRCDACGHLAHPPVVICPSCMSVDTGFSFTPVGAEGRLATWTIMRDAFLPGFKADIPWVIAEVELDGAPGVRLLARLDVEADEDLTIGQAVRTDFVDVAPGVALPVFRLVR